MATEAGKRRPDERRRRERPRRAILRSASKLFRRHGLRQLTIEAIAEDAGVGKATIYRWWPSKAALVLDAIHELDYIRWMLGDVRAVACFAGKQSALDIETEDTAAILLLLFGFPVTLLVTWVWNLTPHGWVLDTGADGDHSPQRRTIELVLCGILGVALLWVIYRELSDVIEAPAREPFTITSHRGTGADVVLLQPEIEIEERAGKQKKEPGHAWVLLPGRERNR